MHLTNRPFITKLFLSISLFCFFLMTPQYSKAQKSKINSDYRITNQLLAEAKNKQFSDTAAALRAGHQALTLAQKTNNGLKIYEAYHQIGRIYQINNEEKKAQPYFLALLTIENSVNDDIKSLIYTDLGNSYKYLGDFKNALHYCLKNQKLGIDTKNLSIEQQSNLQFGSYYSATNDFENATKCLMLSIELSNRLNNIDQICESYRVLTVVYLKSKNCHLALKCIEKSMSYVEKLDDNIFPSVNVYLSYGNALKECGQYEAALFPLKRGLALTLESGDKTYQANASILVADTYSKMNDFKNAEYFYAQCDALTYAISEGDLVAYNYGYGSLLLKKGDYDKAINYLKKSIALAEKHHKKLTLQRVYACLSDVYEKKGNANESLFYLKKSNIYKDSLYADENTKRISEAQLKYDVIKSEKEVQELKHRQFNFSIGGLLFILGLLLAFMMYFSYSKNDKNKILTEKNKEIKDKNRQLEESNEILKQFAYASAHDLKEPLRSINSFVNIIQKKYMKDVPVEAHEYMGFVTTGVRRMESLLNALLEFSSVLTDDNIASKKNDVPTILKDVFHHYENIINERKAVIRYPSVFPQIFMSETHLKQILFNLVNNALKYSKEEAKIEIGFDNRMEELIIFVKDEGIGMEKSYSAKIFKLFQRLDKTSHKESAGIGLTICKNIVDKYAGRLWFESVVNEGTTFFIAFPKTMISDMPISEKGAPQYLEVKGAVLEAHLSA
jgi:signal transduction histidine kinase